MRPLALVVALCVTALPGAALAQQQVSLAPAPSFEQPVELTTPKTSKPVYERWELWAGLGGATVVVAAVVVGILATTARSAATPLKRSDFPCTSGCDTFINAPQQ